MQYYDYHSQARKNSDEVVKEISREQGFDVDAKMKKTDVDKDSLESIWNFRAVEWNKDNGFRGAEPNDSQLRTLKKAGIERIISLNHPTYGIVKNNYSDLYKELGLEHLKLYIPYENEGFPSLSRDELIDDIKQSYKNDSDKQIEVQETDAKIRDFIDNMIKVVEGMRKGYFYVHCDNGTTKTNNALYMLMLLSDLSVYDENYEITKTQKMIENIEKVLTDEDKEKLNYGANI